MEIALAEEADAADWQSFFAAKAEQHHAFSWAWRAVLSETFGHEPRYLTARSSSGAITGALPLFLFKSPLFGKAVISLPYLNAGGIVADSEEAVRALLSRVEKIGRGFGADYIELRNQCEQHWPDEPLEARTHKITMRLALSGDPEQLFSGFPAKLRSQIRRPTKAGFYTEVYNGDAAGVEPFYTVFSEHMRDLGTPVYPKQLFYSVVRRFGAACRIVIVRHDNKPAAAGLTIRQGSHLEIPWASSLRKYSRQSPNMLLYWETIKQACLDGCDVFDFGRSSSDSGTFRFKKQWGSEPRQLYWYYRPLKGALPDVNPDNPKFRLMVQCWRRLPLPVANCIGPRLTRAIP